MNPSTRNIEIDKNMKYALSIKFHVIFWLIMQVYYFYSMDLFGLPFERYLNSKMFFLPFQLTAAYFMLFVLLGKYLYRGKYLKAIIGFIVFIFIFSYLVSAISAYIVIPAFNSEFVIPDLQTLFLDLENMITDYMRVIFLTPLILICLEFGVSQYQKMKDVENLLIQKNNAELDFLKTQIHPNFLLSTLRNLERLTDNNDIDGPKVIERLSEVLDYILYKGRQDRIELSKELDALTDYTTLENIRFRDTTTIRLEFGDLNNSKMISPLILFSFLEFNFKEYDQKTIPFSTCEIKVHEVNNLLFCAITNQIKRGESLKANSYDLNKMKRQLDISYPNRYKIDIHNDHDSNQINLQIEL